MCSFEHTGLPHKVHGKRKRGESRFKTKPDQTAVPEEVNMKKVNYRSNLTGLVKLLKDTKFTNGQLKCLRKTPFWPLFDRLISNGIDLNHCMKYDDVIVRIVQTFKQSSGRFYIGDKNIQIFRSDVSLIFGVDCGTKSMDLSYGAKPTSGIIHRMCKDVSRLSAAKIREILREALKGTKKHDDEEVARLVCMYACVKLFFSTSGETIGWVFYSYMDPLHKMIEYDWAESIRATLMGSLGQNCGKPGRVTGCVMLLMYWLCEHTTILQPHNPNAIPRCVKWDLTALHSNMKSITLAKLGLNEVYGGELMASPTEAKIYRHTKLNVESSAVAKKDESNEDQSKNSQRSDDRDAFSVDAVDLNDVGHYINPSCSTPNAEKGIIIAQPTEPDIVEVLMKENQKAWALVRQWEAKYKQLEESWELRARVIAALEAKLFDQSGSSNVDMHMKTCMEWKDTEIQRLTKLVINLECEKTILEDLFDDQSVHIITQVEAQKAHDSLNNNPTAALEHVISPPSRVKRIKQKVRTEHRLDEFEYPNLPGQKKGKEGAQQKSHAVQIAQDLDKQPPKKQPTKSKKLSLNNKLKVWANMNKLNKQKVQNLHKNGGDELLVWRGDSKTKHVYFDDIIHLIKEESITNNVIDAYGEILLELQGLVNPSLEDSSFIFTSTCLKIIEQYPPHKRNKLIDVHIKEYQGQRFLIFPLHDNFHWTIVVYDVKENRDYITALVHNIRPSSPLWTNLSSQNTSKTIISVDICPQQASNSVDCGPAVCYIMRAHVYREDIVASLDRFEWCQIRDSLVHLFLNHRKTVQCENL
ncbi:hypothetical protein CsSME_00033587 [Camellia sinensis var. sinensis]